MWKIMNFIVDSVFLCNIFHWVPIWFKLILICCLFFSITVLITGLSTYFFCVRLCWNIWAFVITKTLVYHESHNCSLNYVWEEIKLTCFLCLLQVHTVGSQHAWASAPSHPARCAWALTSTVTRSMPAEPHMRVTSFPQRSSPTRTPATSAGVARKSSKTNLR